MISTTLLDRLSLAIPLRLDEFEQNCLPRQPAWQRPLDELELYNHNTESKRSSQRSISSLWQTSSQAEAADTKLQR